MSDRKSSGQMTTGQKIHQFKDYYLGGTIAVLAVAALIIFMVTRFLSPAKDEAALRVAVFDTELSSEALDQLEQAARTSLNLPEDARVVVDTGFVSTNTNEYARLSVLVADGRVDAVIAGEDAFAELAGSSLWNSMTADSVVKAERPVLGVILESENDRNTEGFIRVMME